MSAFAFRAACAGNPLGSLTEAGIGTVDLSGSPGWQQVRPGWSWLMVRMPGGWFVEGIGPTRTEAEADARQSWSRWRREERRRGGGRLAVDGHAYRRRLRHRRHRR